MTVMAFICRRCIESLRRQRLLFGPIHVQRRNYSGSASLVYPLDHRGVIRVAGQDTLQFLQGLITNDTEKLHTSNAIYSLMLNVQGRVLYDTLLFNVSTSSNPCVLMECDKEIIPEFIKLMKRYKVRRKIDIADVGDEFKVFASLSSAATEVELPEHLREIAIPDPRLPSFGWRLITKGDEVAGQGDLQNYHLERYKLGLSEGVGDLPPGKCLPLESNAVFLNGVSFGKGCYIGQELTARTYHTGVTRKRLMPLFFSSASHEFKAEDKLLNSSGKTAGKIRSVHGSYGLGLVRLVEALSGDGPLTVESETDSSSSNLNELNVSTAIPPWWDIDSDEILKNIIAKSRKS